MKEIFKIYLVVYCKSFYFQISINNNTYVTSVILNINLPLYDANIIYAAFNETNTKLIVK